MIAVGHARALLSDDRICGFNRPGGSERARKGEHSLNLMTDLVDGIDPWRGEKTEGERER